MNIYPSFTMVFLVFNLLGWWYKGQPFISWWWFILIIAVQIIMESLILAITKSIIKIRD